MSGNESDTNTSHKLNLPFKAYAGDEPYIFISYKHADSDIVYPVIKQLHDRGFYIWYDAGLPHGKNYDIQISNKIKNSSLFVNFITQTSMDCANDEDDYMIREFSIARKLKKDILPIYLEDVELDGYYLINLLDRQAIMKYEYGDKDELFIQACVDVFVNEFHLQNNSPDLKPHGEPGKRIFTQKIQDPRLTSKHLKEFEELNTTTDSIFDLQDHSVLIILRDGTNLTSWSEVANRKKVIYVSEDLSDFEDLSEKYKDLMALRAIVTLPVSEKATTMESMFEGCNNLVDISGLEEWNVSNVSNMRGLFNRCKKLSDLSALKDWDVGNVKTMEAMFEGCIHLRDLNAIKGWNVSNVSNMRTMFSDCRLEALAALKNWNVANVENMAEMFRGCSALIDLAALRCWKTGNVTDMHSMFEGCFSLDNLYGLRDWDVSNVINMDSIFRTCERLDDLFAIRNWDVGNLKTMESMFRGCERLNDLFALKDWNVGNVNNMRGMFSTCKGLVELTPLMGWDVSNLVNMRSMFYGCISLTDISALRQWDVSNVENMWTMFSYCGALADLSPLKDWNVGNVVTMWAMFSNCGSLTDLTILNDWNVTDQTNTSSIFEGCYSIEKYPQWYRGNSTD